MSAAQAPEAPGTALIPLDTINIPQMFESGNIDVMLQQIEKSAMRYVPDVTTAKGRSHVIAVAADVGRLSAAIDKTAKEHIDQRTQELKRYNDNRRHAREFLKDLKTKTRLPVTEWEAERDRKIAEESRLAMLATAHEEALALHDVWLREQVVKAREAELERQEAEQRRQAAEVQAEKDRQAREARIRQEAAELAERKQQNELEKARERAEKAEKDRQAVIAAAEKQKQDAIDEERRRAAQEEVDRQEAERLRSADLKHRNAVMSSVWSALKAQGVPDDAAVTVVRVAADGKIPYLIIQF